MIAVVKEPFPAGSFHEALKDGVYLCKLINTIQPGSVKKVNTTKMAFKQMENIGNFLTGCENPDPLEVRTWMIAVVKEPFPAGSFHEALNLVWTRLTFSKLRTFIKARTFLKLSKPYLP
jgi:hypothetical protein